MEAGLVPPSQTQFIRLCFTGGKVRVNWCSSSGLRRLWIFMPTLKAALITQSTNCTSATSGEGSPTSSTYTLCTQTEHSFPPSPDKEMRSGLPVRRQSLSRAVFSCPFTGGPLGPEHALQQHQVACVVVGVVSQAEGLSPELAHPSMAGATVVSVGLVVWVSVSRLFREILSGFCGAVAVVV